MCILPINTPGSSQTDPVGKALWANTLLENDPVRWVKGWLHTQRWAVMRLRVTLKQSAALPIWTCAWAFQTGIWKRKTLWGTHTIPWKYFLFLKKISHRESRAYFLSNRFEETRLIQGGSLVWVWLLHRTKLETLSCPCLRLSYRSGLCLSL